MMEKMKIFADLFGELNVLCEAMQVEPEEKKAE